MFIGLDCVEAESLNNQFLFVYLSSNINAMKKITYIIALLTMSIGMFSCSSSESTNDIEVVLEEVDADPVCDYSYFGDSTHFEWVAYKTSEKKGVPGGFNDIKVTSVSSDDPMIVLGSLNFEINTASVETNIEDRNKKISKHFFETINTAVIKGKVLSIDENKTVFEISMNGILVEVEGDYSFENDVFTFETMIDVNAWSALEGIEALNAECSELHTGEDGVSKLWSEVKLSFSTTLMKDCE